MTPLGSLTASDVPAIAALCERSLARPPAADELEACLFADDQPCIVRGDPTIGVVASVRADEGGFIRLLAVDPQHQRRGHGTRLLAAAEDDVRRDRDGPVMLTVGADAPYYLFAGVETSQLAMLYLLERRHYRRGEANYNVDLDLSDIPARPDRPVVAGDEDRDEVDAFMSSQWPGWRAEVLRALAKGTLVIDRDRAGISGFCAWDVNRRGLLGPVGVRLDLIGRGAGTDLMVAALHRIRDTGTTAIEVSWVGPLVPYARLGGTVGRVFFVYRKKLT